MTDTRTALRDHLPRTPLGWLGYALGVAGCAAFLGLIVAGVHVAGMILHPAQIASGFLFGSL